MESFTHADLSNAAIRLHDKGKNFALDAMKDTIRNLVGEPGSYSEEEILAAGRSAGWADNIRDILTEAKRTSKTFTFEELEAACRRRTGSVRTADDLKADIISHREPQYALNTVVKDAKGNWYRKYSDGWGVFGRTGVVLFDVPVRPLKVMS